MEITKGAKHHVNMGNFEWVELLANVTVGPNDLPDPENSTPEQLNELATDILELILADDLEDAAAKSAAEDIYLRARGRRPRRLSKTR